MKRMSKCKVIFSTFTALILLVVTLFSTGLVGYCDELTIADPFDGYTKYEAEDAKLTRCDVERSYGTFSGTGFVAQIDYSNSCMEFTIPMQQSGEYEMILAYAIDPNPVFKDATFRIYNDEGYQAQVTCDKKYGWGEFSRDAVASCTISLKEGENTVSVKRGVNHAQVDFIAIGSRVGDYKEKATESEGFPKPEGYTRYEAENGFVVNAATIGMNYYTDYGSGYSGSGFVGSMNSSECYVDIPVTVEESGTYNMNLRYATESEGGATYKIYVGRYGTDGYLYYYDTVTMNVISSWGVFVEDALADVDIALEKGESFIRIVPDYNYAGVDYIEIGPKKGEYYKGTVETVTSGGEFGDDFFAEDTGDGYAKKSGCNSSLLSAYPIAATIVLFLVSIILWRKKDEKID